MLFTGLSTILPIFAVLFVKCEEYFDYTDYENYDSLESVDPGEVEFVLPSITIGKLTGLTAKDRCSSCHCGIPNRFTRIVGGWMTEVHEYPWMVALSKNGRFFCGGTLINDRFVLTAAHCVQKSKDNSTDWVKSAVKIVLAEHNTAEMGETMTEFRKVKKVMVHPEFSRKNFDHDLALLKLDRKVVFHHGLKTACLPPKAGSYDGEWATVAGWGVTKEGGQPSVYLQETSVPVLSHQQCRSSGYKPSQITDNMICAGDYNNMDSCQGDSGGALLIENKVQQMMTVGVVSWGEGCARPRKPGVYARVDRHLDWILRQTEDACYCY